MQIQAIDQFVTWLLQQDPLYVLVVFLLLRSEIRTKQAVDALKLLSTESTQHPKHSKTTLSHKA